ncbi:PTS system mannitol-specific EIICB component [compost metagenome]
MAPKGGLLPVLSGVITATIVSFLVAALLLKTGKNKEEDLEEAAAKMREMKSAGNTTSAAVKTENTAVYAETVTPANNKDIKKIVFSCDAGMGSSAMGASVLRKKLKAAGVDVAVTNTAISEIPQDADIVVTHQSLTDRARGQNPNAEHISIENFLKSPKYDELVERLKK